MFILKASREEPYEILDVLIEYFAKFCHREKNPLLNSFCSNIFWQLSQKLVMNIRLPLQTLA